MRRSNMTRRGLRGAVAWLLPLCAAWMVPDDAAAQVGRCAMLQQAYITCGNASGRNSTIVDIGSRYLGYAESRPKRAGGLEGEYRSFEFRAPLDPIVAPTDPFAGVEVGREAIFAPPAMPSLQRRSSALRTLGSEHEPTYRP